MLTIGIHFPTLPFLDQSIRQIWTLKLPFLSLIADIVVDIATEANDNLVEVENLKEKLRELETKLQDQEIKSQDQKSQLESLKIKSENQNSQLQSQQTQIKSQQTQMKLLNWLSIKWQNPTFKVNFPRQNTCESFWFFFILISRSTMSNKSKNTLIDLILHPSLEILTTHNAILPDH